MLRSIFLPGPYPGHYREDYNLLSLKWVAIAGGLLFGGIHVAIKLEKTSFVLSRICCCTTPVLTLVPGIRAVQYRHLGQTARPRFKLVALPPQEVKAAGVPLNALLGGRVYAVRSLRHIAMEATVTWVKAGKIQQINLPEEQLTALVECALQRHPEEFGVLIRAFESGPPVTLDLRLANWEIRDEHIQELVRLAAGLQVLSLGPAWQLTSKSLEALKQLSDLRQIDLMAFNDILDDDALVAAIKCWPKLRALSLFHCWRVTGKGLQTVLQLSSNLGLLNLCGCNGLQAKDAAILSNWSGLEEVACDPKLRVSLKMLSAPPRWIYEEKRTMVLYASPSPVDLRRELETRQISSIIFDLERVSDQTEASACLDRSNALRHAWSVVVQHCPLQLLEISFSTGDLDAELQAHSTEVACRARELRLWFCEKKESGEVQTATIQRDQLQRIVANFNDVIAMHSPELANLTEGLDVLITAYPKLSSFAYDFPMTLSVSLVNQLNKGWPELRTLCLSNCETSTYELLVLLNRMPHLQSLTLGRVHGFMDLLPSVAEAASKLREFSFRFGRFHRSMILNQDWGIPAAQSNQLLLEAIPPELRANRLEHLTLLLSHEKAGSIGSILSSSTHINWLTFAVLDSFSTTQWEEWAEIFGPKVVRLDLQGGGWDATTLSAILPRCRRLRWLGLYPSTLVTAESLIEPLKLAPSLGWITVPNGDQEVLRRDLWIRDRLTS